jgi:hypothetical protein
MVLEHDALQAPLQITLRPEMKDGMRLRLTNANLKPSPTGARRTLILTLHVEAPLVRQETPVPTEEEYTVRVPVTAAQIKAEEWIDVNDGALVQPAHIRLRFNMKNGSKLRLPNVALKPSPTGAKRTLIVVLQVSESPSQTASVQPVRTAAARTTPPVRQTPPETSRRTASFAPISFQDGFQLCPESQLKTGFKMGGADDVGYIDLEPARMTVYRKSKAVGMAFGLIGSAIEGKGKLLATIRPEDIASFEKEERKKNQVFYWIHLKDGRLLKVNVIGTRREEHLDAMDRFLSQV